MTCCTTLLADYFHGPRRERYFGLQTVYTTVAATVFFAVGGLLGTTEWRTPFWLYAASLPLAFLAARHVWQPPRDRIQEKLPRLPWRALLVPVGVSLVGGLVFYVLIVELSSVLSAHGRRRLPLRPRCPSGSRRHDPDCVRSVWARHPRPRAGSLGVRRGHRCRHHRRRQRPHAARAAHLGVGQSDLVRSWVGGSGS